MSRCFDSVLYRAQPGFSLPPSQGRVAAASPLPFCWLFLAMVSLAWLGSSPVWGICASDPECDDGVFCNGVEECVSTVCQAGTPPCAVCCDEGTASCVIDTDADGDGHVVQSCGGDDCDDDDPNRYPGNPEVCDAVDHDEDCDPTTYGSLDDDGDRWDSAECCNVRADATLNCGEDCDDSDRGTNVAVPEVCDSIDNDCDGFVDEGLTQTFYVDADLDGWGDSSAQSINACAASPGWSLLVDDCNDSVAGIHPGTTEVCNGVDDDCDGTTDEGLTQTLYLDADLDGWGDSAGTSTMACAASPGWSLLVDDCNDFVPGIHPAAVELCNGVDDDCDGAIDEGFREPCT